MPTLSVRKTSALLLLFFNLGFTLEENNLYAIIQCSCTGMDWSRKLQILNFFVILIVWHCIAYIVLMCC